MADSPRRRQLLEAALHVIADEGLRGLTHRAVDRRAGLPEGSCSAYLRTRSALQQALTEYVAATLLADVDLLAERLRDAAPHRGRAASRPRSTCSCAGSTSASCWWPGSSSPWPPPATPSWPACSPSTGPG